MAVGSYSSGPPAGEFPKLIFLKPCERVDENHCMYISCLGDDSAIIVLHRRRPDNLQVLVLQDHLVVILLLPEVKARVALSRSLLRHQAQILGLHRMIDLFGLSIFFGFIHMILPGANLKHWG